MTLVNAPTIGQWYSDSQHRYFEVVAVNNDDIDIQYIDGAVDELEAETWIQLSPIAVAEPGSSNSVEEIDNVDDINSWLDNKPLQDGWQGFLDKW